MIALAIFSLLLWTYVRFNLIVGLLLGIFCFLAVLLGGAGSIVLAVAFLVVVIAFWVKAFIDEKKANPEAGFLKTLFKASQSWVLSRWMTEECRDLFFTFLGKALLICCVGILIVAAGTAVFRLNWRGDYAAGTLSYTRASGLTYFVDYKPEYQENGVRGYVITEIPFEESFSMDRFEYTLDSDTYYSQYAELSELKGYKAGTAVVDIDALSRGYGYYNHNPKEIPLRFAEIGSHGTYIVIPYSELD